MKYLVIALVFIMMAAYSYEEASETMNLNRYMNRYKWPVKIRRTRNNDWGGQRTIYLDRHAVNCGIGALSRFHLQRAKYRGRWIRIRYDAWCLMPVNCNRRCPATIVKIDRKYCKWRHTRPNILGKWMGLSTNYLDRHYLRCPVHYVITYFRLRSNWHSHKIYYHYRCCPAKVTGCRRYYTKYQAYGNMGNIYLDRQWVHAPNWHTQAIRGFRLLSNYHRHAFRYLVDYCTVRGR